jgi:hypothetical protein
MQAQYLPEVSQKLKHSAILLCIVSQLFTNFTLDCVISSDVIR